MLLDSSEQNVKGLCLKSWNSFQRSGFGFAGHSAKGADSVAVCCAKGAV
jgi:hypothetical protein